MRSLLPGSSYWGLFCMYCDKLENRVELHGSLRLSESTAGEKTPTSCVLGIGCFPLHALPSVASSYMHISRGFAKVRCIKPQCLWFKDLEECSALRVPEPVAAASHGSDVVVLLFQCVGTCARGSLCSPDSPKKWKLICQRTPPQPCISHSAWRTSQCGECRHSEQ